MSIISPKEFMKFCISQGFEFVLVNHENKVINKDNLEELDSIFEKNQGSSWMCRRMQNAKNMTKTWSNQSESKLFEWNISEQDKFHLICALIDVLKKNDSNKNKDVKEWRDIN